MPVIPGEINKVDDHCLYHNDSCQMCALQITSYLCQDSCVLCWVNKQHHLNGPEKKGGEKKRAAEGSPFIFDVWNHMNGTDSRA